MVKIIYRLSICIVFSLRFSQCFVQNRHLLKEMQSTKKLSLIFFHLSKGKFSMQSYAAASSLRFDISWMISHLHFEVSK